MKTGILLMAGRGERLESFLPKQYHDLGGKPVYLHTLEQLLSTHLFEEILLVCEKQFLDRVGRETSLYENVRLVEGGRTRQESSYLGVLATRPDTEVVLIHDAVRPFVSTKILQDNLSAAFLHQAVDTCIPSPDTIVHTLDQTTLTSIPLRSQYWLGQTPQTFSYRLIREAHEEALRREVRGRSDDCSLVLDLGHNVFVVEGEKRNFKITTAYDLEMARLLLAPSVK
jgi:2-C-methyl-D-erythritol 4-phosphate cytidylyltransferase